ncbi:sensor histidine kinase [Lysobacter silvisoli]|uniref:Sensor histidine kinase n=1 Tax=Lysobacter silvisoli TaxID=2293254 RepID=A0A371JY53_9GAMM|nr:histidine kinase [Lysobacter silvisoli]RDZ26603.1 sensor histidine kinase [Lysobacter silvisoli]
MPLPESFSVMGRVAAGQPVLRVLFQPLNLPALLTWLAVALSLNFEQSRGTPAVWLAMAGFAAAFLIGDFLRPAQHTARALLLATQAVSALVVAGLAPRAGTAPALLVILAAQLAMVYPARWTVAAVLAIDLGLYLVLRAGEHRAALIVVLIFAGFQSFAALVARYARSAEDARDQLARVNADLLATRALLADSARDAERLRVARELHDVAGHKLTAMTLNLRALAADPDYAKRPEIAIAQRLSSELLGDIRNVVQAMRDSRGLDLATALRALAAPLPRPRLELSIAEDVHLTDPALAETLLRLVQEALTNSARHADAERVQVAVVRDGRLLRVSVEDDGRLRGPLREGNGLAGMRERVAAAGGRLALSSTVHGALRIEAELPA